MRNLSDSSDFRSTRWTLIGRAAGSSNSGKQDALQELLQIYIPVLRRWLYRKYRMDEHQSDDVIQDFVVSRILQKNMLKAASEQRGRFRSLLLSSLERFVIDQYRRNGAAKRSHHRADSFDESSADLSRDDSTSRDSFDADWAHSVLSEAILRMWKESRSESGEAIWTVFVYRVLVPLVANRSPLPYERLLELCGYSDPRQASNALVTAKRTFNRSLKSVIDEYAVDESEIDLEISELKLVLLRRGSMSINFLPDEVLNNVPFQTAMAGDEDVPERNISGLFSIESLQGTCWGTADIGAMVDHFLKLPLKECASMPLLDSTWKSQTVGYLLSSEDPPIDLLKAVKNSGRSLIKDEDEPTPSEVGAYFYFVAIAAALVRHDVNISKSPSSVLRTGINRLLQRKWLSDEVTSTLTVAMQKLS